MLKVTMNIQKIRNKQNYNNKLKSKSLHNKIYIR